MEDLIRSHEGVTDVAVIGVDDVKYGQVPKAFVVPKGDCADNPELTEQDVHDFVNQRVTDFKRLRGGKKAAFFSELFYVTTIVLNRRGVCREHTKKCVRKNSKKGTP